MKRVLQIVHSMECGGIENLLMNIYKNIDGDKLQFDFLVNGSDECYFASNISSLGGKIYSVIPKRKNFIRNLIGMYKILKEHKEFNVVHIHQDSNIVFAMICARLAHVDNIFVHAHTTSANAKFRVILAKFTRPYIRKHATKLLACSKAAAEWTYGKKITDKNNNIIYLHNGVESSKYMFNPIVRKSLREKLEIENNITVLGTCSHFSIEKNHFFLLDVFNEYHKRNPLSILLLVGDGLLRQQIEEKISNLGLQNYVIITGFVKNAYDYYQVMDIYIMPSKFEGLPLAGVEAQISGLPCFFSTGITSELKITNQASFFPLSLGAVEWCNKILSTNIDRIDTTNQIKKSMYDVKDTAKILEQLYLECKE